MTLSFTAYRFAIFGSVAVLVVAGAALLPATAHATSYCWTSPRLERVYFHTDEAKAAEADRVVDSLLNAGPMCEIERVELTATSREKQGNGETKELRHDRANFVRDILLLKGVRIGLIEINDVETNPRPFNYGAGADPTRIDKLNDSVEISVTFVTPPGF